MADLQKVKLGTKKFPWDTVNDVIHMNLESQGSACEKIAASFKALRDSGIFSDQEDFERIIPLILDAIAKDQASVVYLRMLLQDPRLVFVEYDKWPKQ